MFHLGLQSDSYQLQGSAHINSSTDQLTSSDFIFKQSAIRIQLNLQIQDYSMVFLFVPNIIGYFRYAFLFASLATYRTMPICTIVMLAVSQVLDAFDGMAARKYHQSTDFGAVLDMVCDRSTDAVLLAILAGLYTDYSWMFLSVLILDLTSHWYQMYASISSGQHHKESKSKYTLLNAYYENKSMLFSLCAGNGMFMGVCYLRYFEKQLQFSKVTIILSQYFLVLTFMFFVMKQTVSVVQLMSASQKIAERDVEKRKNRETDVKNE